MTLADKSGYDRIFQKLTRKGGKYAMNYIKTFQKAQALSVSVVNSYSENKLMHTFLENFHQVGKYSAQIATHPAELRKEEKFDDQKYLSVSSLHIDYINLDSSSGCVRNSESANTVQKNCTLCGGANHSAEKYFRRIRKER